VGLGVGVLVKVLIAIGWAGVVGVGTWGVGRGVVASETEGLEDISVGQRVMLDAVPVIFGIVAVASVLVAYVWWAERGERN